MLQQHVGYCSICRLYMQYRINVGCVRTTNPSILFIDKAEDVTYQDNNVPRNQSMNQFVQYANSVGTTTDIYPYSTA